MKLLLPLLACMIGFISAMDICKVCVHIVNAIHTSAITEKEASRKSVKSLCSQNNYPRGCIKTLNGVVDELVPGAYASGRELCGAGGHCARDEKANNNAAQNVQSCNKCSLAVSTKLKVNWPKAVEDYCKKHPSDECTELKDKGIAAEIESIYTSRTHSLCNLISVCDSPVSAIAVAEYEDTVKSREDCKFCKAAARLLSTKYRVNDYLCGSMSIKAEYETVQLCKNSFITEILSPHHLCTELTGLCVPVKPVAVTQ